MRVSRFPTGFLRAPEAQLNPAWADALPGAEPDATVLTRAYSGRLGRCLKKAYVEAAGHKDAPVPAPYPVQRPHLGVARGSKEDARQPAHTGMGGTIRCACPRRTGRGYFAPHLAGGGRSFALRFFAAVQGCRTRSMGIV